MDTKKFTDVSIDGKVYSLGGYESETYLHQVAACVNQKISELKKQNGYVRQDADTKNVLLCLNLADDYLHEKKKNEELAEKLENEEREMYELRHDLVQLKMDAEAANEELTALKEKEKNADGRKK